MRSKRLVSSFVAFVFDTYGSYGSATLKLIDTLDPLVESGIRFKATMKSQLSAMLIAVVNYE